nr:hypothetical protein [Tanacetum cinerariifolium]
MTCFFIIAVQTPGSGNLYCQWELSPGSGNALSILFPTFGNNLYGGDLRRIWYESSKNQDMALPPREKRYLWLRYQVKGYTKEIVQDFKLRLGMIFSRRVNRVHVLDFAGMTKEMGKTLDNRMRMVYTGAEGHVLFNSHAWGRLLEIRALLVRKFILEFFSTYRISDTELGLDVADTLCFQLGEARRRMT